MCWIFLINVGLGARNPPRWEIEQWTGRTPSRTENIVRTKHDHYKKAALKWVLICDSRVTRWRYCPYSKFFKDYHVPARRLIDRNWSKGKTSVCRYVWLKKEWQIKGKKTLNQPRLLIYFFCVTRMAWVEWECFENIIYIDINIRIYYMLE